jgi:6-phosphogluconolactonase
MKPQVRIFTEPEIMADSLAEEFFRYTNSVFLTRQKMFVALSGGNTPLLFFTKLGEFNQQRKNRIEWKKVHFYWGDERCVPPDDADSNFGSAEKVLLSQIDIPRENINRIRGEEDPAAEIERYCEVLKKTIPSQGGIPIFDWIFLGVGEDGHTASIFPDQPGLLNSSDLCRLAKHPENGQNRITLTGTVINSARRITFIAAGENKRDVVRHIINNESAAKKYPAAKILPKHGSIDWYLDSKAADDI